MATDEHAFPVITNVVTGADCEGCLIVRLQGDMAEITCNECGAVVRTVPADKAAAAMVEMASAEICSARCPHCQTLNTFPGFSAILAFICTQCREGVAVERPVQ